MHAITRALTIFGGGRMGTRTPDPLIKSQLLYQLSYAPMGHQTRKLYIFFTKLQVFIAYKICHNSERYPYLYKLSYSRVKILIVKEC